MNRNQKKSKRSQAEVVVTVVLILVALAAVAVVATFVIRLVQQNLTGTDCFKTVAQYEIKSGEEGATCYDAVAKELKVTVARGAKSEYNLTAILIGYGNAESSETYQQTADLPEANEKKTYTVSTSGFTGAIDTISIIPVIGKGTNCEEAKAELQVSACASA